MDLSIITIHDPFGKFGAVTLSQAEAQALATEMIGDGQQPDVYFVSKGEQVVYISTVFVAAYHYWQHMSGWNNSCMLENRTFGVIASHEKNEQGKWETFDDTEMYKGSSQSVQKFLDEELEQFVMAYIEAALWSSNDESTPDGGEPLDKNHTPSDVDKKTRTDMEVDCRRFITTNYTDLITYDASEFTWAQMGGHEFWLSRNGHGTNFLDSNGW